MLKLEERKTRNETEAVTMTWTVEGLIPAIHRPLMLSGAPGTGKSLIGYQLASCISYGSPFLGLPTAKTNTLYVSYEDDDAELNYRTQKTERFINPDNFEGHCFTLCAEYDFEVFALTGGKVRQGKDYAEFVETVRANDIHFVVFDHLSKIFPGDENIRSQVNDFGNMLNRFCREAACTLLILAHTNKTENQYSGSSANAGIFRIVYMLTYNKAKDERHLSIIKSNCTRNAEPITFTINEDLFCDVVNAAPGVDLLALTERDRWYTRPELCAIMGVDTDIQTKAFSGLLKGYEVEKKMKRIDGAVKQTYKILNNKEK